MFNPFKAIRGVINSWLIGYCTLQIFFVHTKITEYLGKSLCLEKKKLI